MDCVFCKIVAGEIPVVHEYENDSVLVFKSNQPLAPVHLLVIPKLHITNFEFVKSDSEIQALGQIQKVIGELVKKFNLQAGYRVGVNGGKYQEVKHIHYHLMSDIDMTKGGVN